MADKILIKRSLTPGSVPTTASLDVGELAINIPDRIIYTRSGSEIITLNASSSYATNADLLDGLNSTQFALTSSNIFTGIQIIDDDTNSTDWTSGALVVSGGVGIGKDVWISGSLNVGETLEINRLDINGGVANLTITGSVVTGIFDATENLEPLIPVDIYSGAAIEYTAQRQTAIRTGIIMASWSGSEVTFTDISNNDIGETWDLSFNLLRINDSIRLRAYSLGSGSGGWNIKVLYKLFPNLL